MSTQPDVVPTIMTAAEWAASTARALARLGLTYSQLAEQARAQDFSSTEARKLWLTIAPQAPRPVTSKWPRRPSLDTYALDEDGPPASDTISTATRSTMGD